MHFNFPEDFSSSKSGFSVWMRVPFWIFGICMSITLVYVGFRPSQSQRGSAIPESWDSKGYGMSSQAQMIGLRLLRESRQAVPWSLLWNIWWHSLGLEVECWKALARCTGNFVPLSFTLTPSLHSQQCWILFGTLTIIFDILEEIIGKLSENDQKSIDRYFPIINKNYLYG